MNYRQRTLVRLLRAFGGHLPRLDLQKYLFLYNSEFQKEPDFEFVPYKFGCFSFQSYADRRRLIELAALSDTEEWQLQKDVEIEKALFDENNFDIFYEQLLQFEG